MAFVVVQEGVYHRLFSLIPSECLVERGALRFFRLHVSCCLLRICEVRWGEGCFVGPESGKILLPIPQMNSY